MVKEFVKNASKVAQKIDIMFEKAAYDNKTVAVHFSVGEKESAIISHMQLNPVNITVNDNIILLKREQQSIILIFLSLIQSNVMTSALTISRMQQLI